MTIAKVMAFAHRRCGKLIVATAESEIPLIEDLQRRGLDNGCEALDLISASEARRLEPALSCKAALSSPMTGIIDSHGYMLALLGDMEDAGGSLAYRAPFLRAVVEEDGFRVFVGGSEPVELTCRTLINAGGLVAPQIAGAIEGLPAAHIPEAYYAKGSYFSLKGRAPFSRLIYPAPHAHGLGVHLTLDIAGQARFGPDIEWIDRIDYAVDPKRSAGFDEAIRRYWPVCRMTHSSLPIPASGPRFRTFRARDGFPHRRTGAAWRCGPRQSFRYREPGLTASLAIADEVFSRLAE